MNLPKEVQQALEVLKKYYKSLDNSINKYNFIFHVKEFLEKLKK